MTHHRTKYSRLVTAIEGDRMQSLSKNRQNRDRYRHVENNTAWQYISSVIAYTRDLRMLEDIGGKPREVSAAHGGRLEGGVK